MKRGTLYGIGVGPGDPELITVKGANLIARCRHIFVPKARTAAESLALSIANRYLWKSS
jgi:precorrin-2/cobalt-factor-2 C20-methyltransferase